MFISWVRLVSMKGGDVVVVMGRVMGTGERWAREMGGRVKENR